MTGDGRTPGWSRGTHGGDRADARLASDGGRGNARIARHGDDRPEGRLAPDGGHRPSAGVEPGGERVEGWPVELEGVLETVAATRGPNGRWNHAALGIEAASESESDERDERRAEPTHATARTWGLTRTRQNLEGRGEAYVQFVPDPVDFVAAALDVHETNSPILATATAWVRVEAEASDRGEEAGTEYVDWTLRPVEAAIRRRVVPKTNRGRAAVVEATVAASRLGVEGYDEEELVERLERLSDVVERCGSDRDLAAFRRIDELTGWRERE